LRCRPDIAISHGSRTQQIAAALLGIPIVIISDYELSKELVLLPPDWLFVPDVIPDTDIMYKKTRVFKYPGIKEDVYVPDFRPDPRVRGMLGLTDENIVATVRPPATEAHYHNPESEILFEATIESMAAREEMKIVILPRNEKQAELIRARWPELCSNGKIIIPREVIDGLNLIWYSDLVVSGGGTMNREAAALGVPVYSIFRGGIGAVDRYLAENGRLTLLETVEDVRTKSV
jgi:predicted glycosyltransferase